MTRTKRTTKTARQQKIEQLLEFNNQDLMDASINELREEVIDLRAALLALTSDDDVEQEYEDLMGSLASDFESWTGGFAPESAEHVEEYLGCSLPAGYDKDAGRAYLLSLIK